MKCECDRQRQFALLYRWCLLSNVLQHSSASTIFSLVTLQVLHKHTRTVTYPILNKYEALVISILKTSERMSVSLPWTQDSLPLPGRDEGVWVVAPR